jgi:hypothetical protein
MRIFQLHFSVDDKSVLVMTVAQFQLDKPPAIHQPAHTQRMPIIEITDDLHRLGLRASTIKIDRPGRIVCGIACPICTILYDVHKQSPFLTRFGAGGSIRASICCFRLWHNKISFHYVLDRRPLSALLLLYYLTAGRLTEHEREIKSGFPIQSWPDSRKS